MWPHQRLRDDPTLWWDARWYARWFTRDGRWVTALVYLAVLTFWAWIMLGAPGAPH